MNFHDLIQYPLLTEKSTQARQSGQYCFVVDRRANKILIKGAVEEIFGVKVASVRVLNEKPKVKKNRFSRKPGKTAGRKKAMVFLKKGEKITELDV